MSPVRTRTPYSLVSAAEPTQEATKRELVRVSRQVEQVARRTQPPMVAAALQDARHLSDLTRGVYAQLAEAGTTSRLHARDLQSWLAPGVHGVALDDGDPLVDEWVIVVPGSEPVAFAATDLAATGVEDDDRRFRYAVSRDPHVVAACGRLLGV